MLLMTTGFEFQGYFITEYLDVIFDEILVGLGLGKSITSAVDNFVSFVSGGEASEMIDRLNVVKRKLQVRVIEKALAMGANGLIGIDFESSKLGDLIMVSMTATAVKMVRIIEPLPITEENAARREAVPELNVRKLNALVDALYRKTVFENNEELNANYQGKKAERDAAENEMKAFNAVFAEKKAVLEQHRSATETVKSKIAETENTIEKLKRYSSQRNMGAQIAEKTRELQQAEAELTRLSEETEILKQDVRAARDAAAEKRERFRILDAELQEFIERNKL